MFTSTAKYKYALATGIAVLLTTCINASLAKPESNSPETPVIKTEWVRITSVKNKDHNKALSERSTITISGVTFATTVDSGLKIANEQKKPLIVFIKKDGCPHCAAFEKDTLSVPSVEKYLADHYVCSRVLSGSADEQILKRDFGCNSFPHFVVFDGNGKLIGRWYGQPHSAEDFIAKAKIASGNSN